MCAWFSTISGLFEAGLRFCFSVLPTVCSRSFVAPPPCWSWDLDQFYFSYIILANQKLTVKTPSIALERVKATVSPWADLVMILSSLKNDGLEKCTGTVINESTDDGIMHDWICNGSRDFFMNLEKVKSGWILSKYFQISQKIFPDERERRVLE